MNSDLLMLLSLRRALESAEDGRGMASSLVDQLADEKPHGTNAARLLLLGFPIEVSLRPLVESDSEEVSMLASLIISAPRSSTPLVGKTGGALATTLERWVKTRENAKLEHKVLRFRSFVTSAVLGAVTAMVASLGPIVGSLDFGSSTLVSSSALMPAAAGMTAISAGMLGYFMSGRGFFANVAVSLTVFALVGAIASPLAAVPYVALWGVK